MRKRYRPDAEARALAHENARRNGARATRPLVTLEMALERDPEGAGRYALAWDPEEERRAQAAAIWAAIDQVAKGQAHGAIALEEAMRRFGEAVGPIFERMAQVINDISRWLEPLNLQAEAPRPGLPGDRARHGRAAQCPRHGPTTGGLCRRCVR